MNKPIVIERIYNAPVAKVWEALTDKEAMKVWCFDVSGFKPEVGYTFTFDGTNEGVTFKHECVVTIVEPGKKLAYSWRYIGYGGMSEVAYELFAEGEQTRLRLTHDGIETIAVNGPAFAKENFVTGWTEIIGTLLKNYVE